MTDILSTVDEFANVAHEGYFRKNGVTPYITHPRRVSGRLLRAGVKCVEIRAAALLHDAVEDTPLLLSNVEQMFGAVVSGYVDEMTKKDSETKTEYLNSFRYKTIGACLIKLADRFDNLLDFDGLDPNYKRDYSLQGMELVCAVMRNSRWKKAPVTDVKARDLFVTHLTRIFLDENC